MITSRDFGKLPCGEPAKLYKIENASGAYVEITNYGGIIVSIVVPDREGKLGDVLLGCKTVEDYIPNNGYLGALIGRIGNRINQGKCVLNGKELQLARNSNGHHLHGGDHGFNEKVWAVEELPEKNALRMSIVSPAGEENYPGELKVCVTYAFNDRCELSLHYEAEASEDTLVNLTNHAYFNLNGEGGAKITNHVITIHAERFTPGDAGLIPTGELKSVAGTFFDLRQPTRIGDHIDDFSDDQLKAGGGYDHNFCLDGEGLREAVVLESPETGRVMRVCTDQPGVQFYAGNALDGTMNGKCGRKYTPRDGMCLETQNYPDAINHPNFPSCVFGPGRKYDYTTIYAFSTDRK